MPTPSEQKALAFVAIVILLGGAVRVVRAGSSALPSENEQQALATQAASVDSAATRNPANRRSKPPKTKRDARPTEARASMDLRSPSERLGFPPPGPRIDIGVPARPMNPGTTVRVGAVDLDVASVLEIEALPHIGPSLAKRIVANRDSLGPFRSLDGLKRVKGLGDVTIKLLAPRVTFSGR